jgi:hypothetical protein
LRVGRTLPAILLLALSCATAEASKSADDIYRLPAPLIVDPVANYGSADGKEAAPAPRRGVALQGYRYDAHNGPDWTTVELAQQATKCGDRLKLPPEIYHDADLSQPVVERFWLVHAPPEALYITRRTTLTALDDCVATVGYSLEIDRLLFNAGHVTELSWQNGKWGAPQTRPIKGFSYGGSRFLPVGDLAFLQKRYRKTTFRQPLPTLPGTKTICFGVGSSIDTISDCHLDEPGPYRGLLLSRTMFHTETYEEGVIVDFLKTGTLIDGRLFEWDREISLTP